MFRLVLIDPRKKQAVENPPGGLEVYCHDTGDVQLFRDEVQVLAQNVTSLIAQNVTSLLYVCYFLLASAACWNGSFFAARPMVRFGRGPIFAFALRPDPFTRLHQF